MFLDPISIQISSTCLSHIPIKKTSGPKYKLGDVLNAVSDVSSGFKTYRQVPLTVIFNRINGRKTNINHIGSGRQCELTLEVEDEHERCLIARAEMGYPCSRKELKEIVQEYIQHNQLETRFTEGLGMCGIIDS